jgi:hypothetical protein
MAKWNEGANWTPFDDINGGQQFTNALTPEDLNKLAENIAYLYAHQGENEYLGAYAGGNYRAGAIVKYSDGNIYLCIKDTDDEQEPTDTEYWQMLNEEGTDTSDATATADMVISGQTFYGANGKETGTMPDYGYYATGSFFASLNTDKTYIDLNGAYSGKVFISPEELTITENGDYEASEGKVISKVKVAVESGVDTSRLTATADKVLADEIFVGVNGEETGTMENNGYGVGDFTHTLDTDNPRLELNGAYGGEVHITLEEKTVTANGTYEATDGKVISKITVAVEGEDKATPIEVSTEAEMTALLESGEVGGVYKYTGTTGTYENGALYVLEEEAVATKTLSVTNNGNYSPFTEYWLDKSNTETADGNTYLSISGETTEFTGISSYIIIQSETAFNSISDAVGCTYESLNSSTLKITLAADTASITVEVND